MPRAIHHVGLSVANPRSATDFYKQAFGFSSRRGGNWTARQIHDLTATEACSDEIAVVAAPNMLLALFETACPPRPMPRPVYAQGITHICVQANRMETLSDKALHAGASFHASPTDLGGEILYAYPRDPDGNVIELEAIPQAPSESGPWIAHVSFTTSDIDRLVKFYEALVEAPARRSPRIGPNAKIDQLTGLTDAVVTGAWLSIGNAQLEFWQYHQPATTSDVAGPGYTHVAFEIESPADVEAITQRLRTSFREDSLVDGARCFFGNDPDGNRIALVAPIGAAKASVSSLADPGIVARVEAARQGAQT